MPRAGRVADEAGEGCVRLHHDPDRL